MQKKLYLCKLIDNLPNFAAKCKKITKKQYNYVKSITYDSRRLGNRKQI